MYDTSTDFEATLAAWENFALGQKATDQDIAELITFAQSASVHAKVSWPWAKMRKLLVDRAGYKDKLASSEAKTARIKADLGAYPDSPQEFVTAWLTANGYTITFSEQFQQSNGRTVGLDTILNHLKIWTEEMGEFKTPSEAATRLILEDQRHEIMKRAFLDLSFDPSIDPDFSELKKFVRLVVRDTANPETNERNYRAAEVAIRNAIHRTKNHIGAYVGIRAKDGGRRWTHKTHMMVVFFGPQGSGKTTAMGKLLAPLGERELSTGVGFDVLEDNSRNFKMSYMPAMTFDELAGLKKADAEKFKGIMHEERRDFRQIYRASSALYVVSTFFGATNRDMNDSLKDETGNRRIHQIETPVKMDLKALKAIDPMMIWRSVDEDADPPMYADADDLAAIEEIQAEGKHLSSVEDWIASAEFIPDGWSKAATLFEGYGEFVKRFHPSEERYVNKIRFSRELTRIARTDDEKVEIKEDKKYGNQYRITRPFQRGTYSLDSKVTDLRQRLPGLSK